MEEFKVKSIHHLGFVVKDLDMTIKNWERLFGVQAEMGENPEIHVRFGKISLAGLDFIFNESTQAGSRWEKYLEEHGEGLEHVAIEVDDIEAATGAARKLGFELKFEQLVKIHGLLTNFVNDMDATDIELMGPEK